MAKLKLVDNKGKDLGELQVRDDVFQVKPNEHLLYLAVVRQEANARAGTASTLTRPEVAGGGRKPWKQKGTGSARAGSIRSPLWRKGGVMHGPTTDVNWTKGMNKKEKAIALKSALSLRMKDTIALKNTGIKEGKTKEFAALLDSLKLTKKKSLFIISADDKNLIQIKRAAKNIVLVKAISSNELNVKDLLNAQDIVITEEAAEALDNRFKALS